MPRQVDPKKFAASSLIRDPIRFLQNAYKLYNDLYFGGQLTEDVRFQWKPMQYDTGWRRGNVIGINSAFGAWPRVVLMTLLHEMVHLKRDSEDHGKKFDRSMLKLATKGAFNLIW